MSGAALLGVCLALAAGLSADPAATLPPAGDVRVHFEPAPRFTLAWTHSIEKTRWEEDYRVLRAAVGALALRLERARIRGSGAGMEPPVGAQLRDGWYEYQPADQPEGPLRLTRSPYTADYDWCVAGACVPLVRLLPSDGGVTLLWPCEAAS